MPPRTRTRIKNGQKENIQTQNKVMYKEDNIKVPRRTLAKKTNAASDDNCNDVHEKVMRKNKKRKQITECKEEVQPRRERRLPRRLENNEITTSKKNNVSPTNSSASNKKNTNIKKTTLEIPSVKTGNEAKNESILLGNRPRRICQLPSRFDDHILSPNKSTSLQPINASTPLQKSRIPTPKQNKVLRKSDTLDKVAAAVKPARKAKKVALGKFAAPNTSPDTNNNPKSILIKTNSLKKVISKQNTQKTSPDLNAKKPGLRKINDTTPKRIIRKIPEVQVLGDNKLVQNTSKTDLDIYNFTFDPDEEPQEAQKKKRKKRNVNKTSKVTKPKRAAAYRSAYQQNISKALAALKNVIQQTQDPKPTNLEQIVEINEDAAENVMGDNTVNYTSVLSKENQNSINDALKTPVHAPGFASIRIEDIAADIEPSLDDHDINYSPVNTPLKENSMKIDNSKRDSQAGECNKDPLNLQEGLSFFDDIPVASSSMNTSVRHPLASPWRVEFGNLPIKWHSNTYMKPNMTPAVESSFICSEESNKKKHVYTNMLADDNDPEVNTSKTSSLKQPTLISFIKEIAEKKARAKKGRNVSRKNVVPLIENVQINENIPSNQVENEVLSEDSIPNNSKCEEVLINNNENNDSSSPKEKAKNKEKRNNRKRKIDENINKKSNTSPQKQKNKDCTYFGFDDSEDKDVENISPIKMKAQVKGRNLRPRLGTALKEVNGPLRVDIPVAVKTKTISSADALENVYKKMKPAEEVPDFPADNVQVNTTNLEDPTLNDDSQSVHLFEDIELIHHLKPTRKSYGKAKKVAFCQQSEVESHSLDNLGHNDSSYYEDDFGDLTFEIPNVKEKKRTTKKPKKLRSKKEEKEAEEWAAGFNSMCEEIEEFPLVVE